MAEEKGKDTKATCRGCKNELPEGWKYPYCAMCHHAWQRQQEVQLRSRVREELQRVHRFLQQIFDQNPAYDYSTVREAFAEVVAAYESSKHRGVIRALYQEVLPLANKITAEGTIGYVEGLLAEPPGEDFSELRALLDEAEYLFGEGKFHKAAGKAYEACQLAGKLGLCEKAEAERDREVLASLKL